MKMTGVMPSGTKRVVDPPAGDAVVASDRLIADEPSTPVASQGEQTGRP